MPTYNSSKTLNNQRIPEGLKVDGSLTFNNLDVQGNVKVDGSVNGSTLTCQNFTVDSSVTSNHVTCQNLKVGGSTTGNHINCQNLKIAGSLTGSSITVTGQGSVDGSCAVNGFNVNNTLKVRGSATGQRWDIRGDTVITGCLKASDQSRFTSITLYSYDSTLEHSTANNIIIKRCALNRPQLLRLSQGTVINGNVTFEDGQGVIYVDSTSRVTGTVTGGTVITDDRLARADQVVFHNSTRYVNYVNGQEVPGDANNFGNTTITITILPPLWLIVALLIGCIASFAFGGPLWLGITLAVLTALCIGGKLVGEMVVKSSHVESADAQSQLHVPGRTIPSHQATPNAGPDNQAQNARTESPNNPQSSNRRPTRR